MIGYFPEHQVAAIRREIHHNEKGKILGSMKSIQNVFGYEDHLLRNDYEMIKKAGLGVAMGNAFDEVKEIARFVTAADDEDGFAKAVYKFI